MHFQCGVSHVLLVRPLNSNVLLQLEIQINEVAESKAETERVERKLEAEKERHKTMVLFLINERKQMLVKMHELRVKSESNGGVFFDIFLGLNSFFESFLHLEEMLIWSFS